METVNSYLIIRTNILQGFIGYITWPSLPLSYYYYYRNLKNVLYLKFEKLLSFLNLSP